MNTYVVILLIVISTYLWLILILIWGIFKIPISKSLNFELKNRFSIVVPFRNEAHNLPDLLHSLVHLSYPKKFYEIILVNDASTDIYRKIIETFQNQNPGVAIALIENQRQSNSPKKDAINTAIKGNHFEWILTTDADSVLNHNILHELNNYIEQHQPNFIAGLVKMKADDSILQQFQKWDWNSLLGFTLAGFGYKIPLICSGAYMCYQKEMFLKVNGFSGNEHIVSGDDVFLMQKMNHWQPEKVHFIFQPDVVVQTKSLKTWHELIEQRKRWMSKTSSVHSNYLKITGILVWFTNSGCIASLFLAFLDAISWRFSITFIIVKWSIDMIYLTLINRRVNEKINFSSLIISNIIYPFFSFSIPILWFFNGFTWKERTFKK